MEEALSNVDVDITRGQKKCKATPKTIRNLTRAFRESRIQAVHPHKLISLQVMSPLILPEFKGSTVDVSIIHAGQITVPAVHILQSPIPGHDLLDIPCYSFLIENNRSQKVLFDLGLRKDWREKLPPTSKQGYYPWVGWGPLAVL